jgi:hypothetical protein
MQAADGRAAAISGWNTRGRVLAAWHGQRNHGQRLLEMAVIGVRDFDGAREALEATVREVVVSAAPTG